MSGQLAHPMAQQTVNWIRRRRYSSVCYVRKRSVQVMWRERMNSKSHLRAAVNRAKMAAGLPMLGLPLGERL